MERTALYRHFTADGALLYVGISLCAAGRLRQHAKQAPWFDQIARVDVQWFDDRQSALKAELHAIKSECPEHNKMHSSLFFPERYLNSPQDFAELLDDALQSGHAGYIAVALGTVARAYGISKLAEETGLNRATLYAALKDGGNPTLDTVMKVAGAIGVQLNAKQLA